MGDLPGLYLCGVISTAFALSLSSEKMSQPRLVLAWLLMAALWPITLAWIFWPSKKQEV